MRIVKYFLITLVTLLMASCIYEYSQYIPAGIKLRLAFKLDTSTLDEYPQISDLSREEYDIRYVIRAYRMTGSGKYHTAPHAEFIYTKDDINSLDSTMMVELDEGRYIFHTVADYVPQYEVGDNHFNTRTFSDLHIRCDQYHGSTDSKTLFAGYKESDVQRFTGTETTCDTVLLRPVLAKYQIVATDLQDFYDMMVTRSGEAPDLVAMHLENYKVKVRYSDKDPLYTHMNILEGNNPTRGETGLSFESKITKLNDTEAMLCFDHVMVGDAQKVTKIRVGIYKNDGTHITTIPLELPLQKGRFTCFKGRFLTHVGLENEGEDGVIVNPDFDADFDVDVD